ncbi:MAG TPA: MliC family protein [Bacillota bacterium]|nr:MliC family protein [Bacillota bacterium]
MKRFAKKRSSKNRSLKLIVIVAIVLVIVAMVVYLNSTGFRKRVNNRPSPSATSRLSSTQAATPTSRLSLTQAVTPTSRPGSTQAATITYFCREGVITAAYLDHKVRLVLPDGRKFELPQAVAASGIRFTDGKIEFWSKGANAWVTENNQIIYSDGVAGTISYLAGGAAEFTDYSKTFSFRFPRNLVLSGKGIGFTQGWRAGTVDYGVVLALVSIPGTFAPQTNFSGAEFTIGRSSDPEAVKNSFIKPQGYGVLEEPVKFGGVSFTKYTFSDAGAGNLYVTTSYRTRRGEGCYVVEYTIHSTNIGNYSPDQGITEFDKAMITGVLEGMVRSFRFLQ